MWYNSSQTTFTELGEQIEVDEETVEVLWYAVEPASPLACVQQEQWCFADLGCTPLTGMEHQKYLVKHLTSDNGTLWRRRWIANAIDLLGCTIPNIPETLGGKSLTSRFGLSDGYQGIIVDGQWQQDVMYWVTITLAAMQQMMITAVTGDFADPSGIKPPDSDIAPPYSDTVQTVCASQVGNPSHVSYRGLSPMYALQSWEQRLTLRPKKIISQVHISFSVFGLAFILVAGLLIIVISFVLEPLARCIHRCSKRNPYARVEWYSTSIFQLQRLAHEEIGIGTWDHCDESIPTTAPGTILAALDITDESHPLLCVPEKSDVPEEPPAATGSEESSIPTPDAGFDHPHSIQTADHTPNGNGMGAADVSPISGELQSPDSPASPMSLSSQSMSSSLMGDTSSDNETNTAHTPAESAAPTGTTGGDDLLPCARSPVHAVLDV